MTSRSNSGLSKAKHPYNSSVRDRRAIQIDIADPEFQAYLQRYPFASGPDRHTNDICKKAVEDGIRFRDAAPEADVTMLQADQTHLASSETERVQELFNRIGLTAREKEKHLDDFEWEANLVPRAAKNVLVIGCGDGIELIFLRAVLPQANITAIDYRNSLLPRLADAVGLNFLEGDIGKHLPTLGQEYDLIFSNHTLEHLYAPDATLSVFARLLVQGGHLLSTMPIVGTDGTPFLGRIREFIRDRSSNAAATIHPLELDYFDCGHPWKTNPDDLMATLKGAGFTDVRIYQREGHRCRPAKLSDRQYRLRRNVMVFTHRIVFGAPRRLAMVLFPRNVPSWLPVLFFALQRRLPFGANRVVNFFSQESLFVAQVARPRE